MLSNLEQAEYWDSFLHENQFCFKFQNGPILTRPCHFTLYQLIMITLLQKWIVICYSSTAMFGATALRRKRERERREKAAREAEPRIFPFIKPFGRCFDKNELPYFKQRLGSKKENRKEVYTS